MAFTVTATQGGATANGIGLNLFTLSGQAASPMGATATAAAKSATITPTASGSLIFGSILTLIGTPTPLVGTTLLADQNPNGTVEMISVMSTGTTTGVTPLTIGVTSAAGAISTALLEVLTGTGSLSPFIGSPAATGSTSGSVTSGSISPPAGSLLVLMVQSNGAVDTTTVAVTDTSGLGITWVEQVKANGASNGYAGIWTAVVPATVPTTLFGQTGGANAASDSSAYTLGMQFSLSQSTPLTGIWFHSGSGATALPVGCGIYDLSGPTLVASNLSPSWSGAAGSGWVKCSFPGTFTLTAGVNYEVCILKDTSPLVYASTAHYWDGGGAGTSGLVSGIVSAPDDAVAANHQDAFHVGPTLAPPNASFNASNYWVDVEVTASGGPPPPVPALLMASFP